VHVRWQTSVDQATRLKLEERFQLAAGTREEGQTWRYDLRDTSQNNVRAIVSDPSVADTHHIDRRADEVSSDTERTSRPERLPIRTASVLQGADLAALICVVFAIWPRAGGRSGAAKRQTAAGGPRQMPGRVLQSLTRWLAPWIPHLDGGALGAFRIALGAGFVWVALSRELTAQPLGQQQHRALIDLDFVHRLAATEAACTTVEMSMLIAALLFAAGVFARMSYTAFVAAFAVSTLMTLERTSAHDLGLPLVTFLGWLTVPWSAGRDAPPQRAYGFAIWWPGLTVGVALLAAAYWKLHQSGLEWITEGAVKYHFIADSANAHVDWGLRVAANPTLAVLLSAGAIVVEAAFIANIFVRGPWTRLAMGAMGAGLFVALYLFQGIYWPAWHVLFLAFLPWPLLNTSASTASEPARAMSLRTAQALVVVMLLAVQGYASASGKEAEPLMSHFPMYAHNYASTTDFEASLRPRMTRVLAVTADGRDISAELSSLVDNDRFLLMDLAEQTSVRPISLSERAHRDRSLLCERFAQTIGPVPEEVTFAIERRGFDWENGQFRDYEPVLTSPVPLRALCEDLSDVTVTQ
jgi:hypothetical protein